MVATIAAASNILLQFWLLSVFLGRRGGLALKCFQESQDETLRIINCAYFAFGNTQVCFTRRLDGHQEGARGCDYLTQLGVDLGPPKNLTEELSCAFRNPREDEYDDEDDTTMVEVCACNQDLCNTYNNASTMMLPTMLVTFESKASYMAVPMMSLLTVATIFLA